MKKLIFALLVTSFCLNVSGHDLTTADRDIPTDLIPIVLQGKLDLNHSSNDVDAYFNQNSVYIYFNGTFGNVSVSLYNETGVMIYNNVVNTNAEMLLIIPISFFSSGTYLLLMESLTGYVEGEFEKAP